MSIHLGEVIQHMISSSTNNVPPCPNNHNVRSGLVSITGNKACQFNEFFMFPCLFVCVCFSTVISALRLLKSFKSLIIYNVVSLISTINRASLISLTA